MKRTFLGALITGSNYRDLTSKERLLEGKKLKAYLRGYSSISNGLDGIITIAGRSS